MRDRTFVMIKPDAIGRDLKGDISAMIEAAGFSILRARTQRLSKADAEFLYEEHSAKAHFNDLVAFTTSDEAFLMEVEGESAIRKVRELVGPSDIKAASARPWTIRGKYAEDHRRNCVHSSDGMSTAARELKYFFGGESK